MSRIKLVLGLAAVMVAMLIAFSAPAIADICMSVGSNACDEPDVDFVDNCWWCDDFDHDVDFDECWWWGCDEDELDFNDGLVFANDFDFDDCFWWWDWDDEEWVLLCEADF